MVTTRLKARFPQLRCGLVALCLLDMSGVGVQAQDDDDSVFVEPAWARSVMEQDDFEASFKELNRLEPLHLESYVIPLLRSRIWSMKADEAGEDRERIAALQQEHRFLLRAKALATGPQNAAMRAEIENDIANATRLLRDEGAAPLASSAGTLAKPKAVAKAPVARKPAAAAPIVRPVKATPIKKLSPLKPRRGYVIGRAIFPDGRPIPRFKVNVLGYDGQVNLGRGSTPTLGWGEGKNGFYAIRTVDTFQHKKPVAGLVTSVQLKAKFNYRGQFYTMFLHPIDGLRDGGSKGEFKGNSGPGVVRDFVLKISGVKPQWTKFDQDENNGPNDPGTFYGGQLTLNLTDAEPGSQPLSSTAPKGSQLHITLVPLGPLLDGSPGQTQVRKVNIDIAPYYFYVRNIPIGAYSVSAQLRTPGGEVWPLRGNTVRGETYGSATKVEFPASSSGTTGGVDVASLYLVR